MKELESRKATFPYKPAYPASVKYLLWKRRWIPVILTTDWFGRAESYAEQGCGQKITFPLPEAAVHISATALVFHKLHWNLWKPEVFRCCSLMRLNIVHMGAKITFIWALAILEDLNQIWIMTMIRKIYSLSKLWCMVPTYLSGMNFYSNPSADSWLETLLQSYYSWGDWIYLDDDEDSFLGLVWTYRYGLSLG